MTSTNSSNHDHPTARMARHLAQSPPTTPRPLGAALLQVARDLAEAADEAWTHAASPCVTTARRGPGTGGGRDAEGMTGGLVALDRALALQLAAAQAISLVPPGDLDTLDAIPLSPRGVETAAADPLRAPRLEVRGERRPAAAIDGRATFSSDDANPRDSAERGVPVELVRSCEQLMRQAPRGDLPIGMSPLLMAVYELLRDYAALPKGVATRPNQGVQAAGEWSSGQARVTSAGGAPAAATARPPTAGLDGPGDAGDIDPRQAGSHVPSDHRAGNA
ncbi:hypothetical protein V3N99_21650 [Dermatophilaceae bacterium Soc4.6]